MLMFSNFFLKLKSYYHQNLLLISNDVREHCWTTMLANSAGQQVFFSAAVQQQKVHCCSAMKLADIVGQQRW